MKLANVTWMSILMILLAMGMVVNCSCGDDDDDDDDDAVDSESDDDDATDDDDDSADDDGEDDDDAADDDVMDDDDAADDDDDIMLSCSAADICQKVVDCGRANNEEECIAWDIPEDFFTDIDLNVCVCDALGETCPQFVDEWYMCGMPSTI